MSNLDLDDLPSCFALAKPEAPNKCEECQHRTLCKKMASEFIPKSSLIPILKKLERIEAILVS